jgi:hypothetical protein
MYAQAMHYAEYCLRNKGTMPPALFVICSDSPAVFFGWAFKFDSTRAHNLFRDVCRLFCLAHDAKLSVLVLETLLLPKTPPPGTRPQDAPPTIMPSAEPDIIEAITMLSESWAAEPQLSTAKIVRSDNGKFFSLAPREQIAGHLAAGEFSHLLPPPFPAPKEVRVAAKTCLNKLGIYQINMDTRKELK